MKLPDGQCLKKKGEPSVWYLLVGIAILGLTGAFALGFWLGGMLQHDAAFEHGRAFEANLQDPYPNP